MSVSSNDIFNAIRASHLLGEGSCSIFDECYTDDELLKTVLEDNEELEFKSINEALKFYRRVNLADAQRDGFV